MATATDDRVSCLLSEVQAILEPLKSGNPAAARVSKEIGEMIKEERTKGFSVIRKYKVKLAPGQLNLLAGTDKKEQRSLCVSINKLMTSEMNAGTHPSAIKDLVGEVLNSEQGERLAAYNEVAIGLVNKIITRYGESLSE